jgi:hypothetical protein
MRLSVERKTTGRLVTLNESYSSKETAFLLFDEIYITGFIEIFNDDELFCYRSDSGTAREVMGRLLSFQEIYFVEKGSFKRPALSSEN